MLCGNCLTVCMVSSELCGSRNIWCIVGHIGEMPVVLLDTVFVIVECIANRYGYHHIDKDLYQCSQCRWMSVLVV